MFKNQVILCSTSITKESLKQSLLITLVTSEIESKQKFSAAG